MIQLTVRRALAFTALLASAVTFNPANALPFSDLVIFGDSLSDTGNLNALTGGAFPDVSTGPYYQGRYSNGPVWVETLANGLGLSSAAQPFVAGGNNYAIAGARTDGSNNPPGMLAQVAGLWGPSHPAADPNALYVLFGGANDMRSARSLYQTNSAADQLGRQNAAQQAINNLLQEEAFLASRGARHILLANLPDLGATPEAALLGLQAASHDASAQFNALIPLLLTTGIGLGLDIDLLDIATLMQSVITDTTSNGGATYGFTNITSPCAGFTYSNGASCDVSLFSDALHPSARAHELIGEAALVAVGVPEPATMLLFAIGMLALVVRRRA